MIKTAYATTITFLLAMVAVSAHAADPAALAKKTLSTLNQVEVVGMMASPARLSVETRYKKFGKPLADVKSEWPMPISLPASKPMKAYGSCLDAIGQLEKLLDLRIKNILPDEQQQARAAYWSLKGRCEAAVNNKQAQAE